jgi:hypothetical protein
VILNLIMAVVRLVPTAFGPPWNAGRSQDASRRAYYPRGGDEATKLYDRTGDAISLEERACPAPSRRLPVPARPPRLRLAGRGNGPGGPGLFRASSGS